MKYINCFASITRFSSFVKSGAEAFILGNIPSKVAIKHSDKLKIVVAAEGMSNMPGPIWVVPRELKNHTPFLTVGPA